MFGVPSVLVKIKRIIHYIVNKWNVILIDLNKLEEKYKASNL